MPVTSTNLFSNPRVEASGEYPKELETFLNRNGFDAAWREITSWQDYDPTPLETLPDLAGSLEIGEIYYKDEGIRFGLGSFKVLGGSYAVGKHLASCIGRGNDSSEDEVSLRELATGRHRPATNAMTVCCATDGNHGRAVAWGAKRFGCRARVYLHTGVSPSRQEAIERLGAICVRVRGDYDDSVGVAAEEAESNGWATIADTSDRENDNIPRHIMHGYGVLVDEILHKLKDDRLPTHVFVQAGVGGLAATVCARTWISLGEKRPRLVIVEPERADPLYQSAIAATPRRSSGDLNTVMAGLACGKVSIPAWRILERGAHDFVTIPDKAAVEAMRILARREPSWPPIIAGESGAAGLAGLLRTATSDSFRRTLGISKTSRILLLGTEGATDPEIYRKLIAS